MPTRARPWLAAATLTALLPTAIAAGGIREDEFHCEEAVAHLVDCCPALSAHAVHCTHEAGCGGGTLVALSTGDSACIQELDCADIVAAQICERVAQLSLDGGVSSDGTSTGGDAGARVDVCP